MSAAVLIPAVAGLWFLAVVGVVGTCSAASRAEAAYLRGLRVRRLRVARRPVLWRGHPENPLNCSERS